MTKVIPAARALLHHCRSSWNPSKKNDKRPPTTISNNANLDLQLQRMETRGKILLLMFFVCLFFSGQEGHDAGNELKRFCDI